MAHRSLAAVAQLLLAVTEVLQAEHGLLAEGAQLLAVSEVLQG